MAFWQVTFSVLLLVIWVIAGGYITQTSRYVGYYKSNDTHLDSAYWYAFWAAFITWTLIGIFLLLVILAVAGVIALFGSGAGEAGGVAVAGEEAAVAGEREAGQLAKSGEKQLVKEEQNLERNATKNRSKGKGNNNKKQKNKKSSGFVTWCFFIFSMLLVIVTGILSALSADQIQKSSLPHGSGTQLYIAYNSAIIAACMCLGAVGLIIIGMISYAVYTHKQNQKQQQQQQPSWNQSFG